MCGVTKLDRITHFIAQCENYEEKTNNFFLHFVSMEMAAILDVMPFANVHVTLKPHLELSSNAGKCFTHIIDEETYTWKFFLVTLDNIF